MTAVKIPPPMVCDSKSDVCSAASPVTEREAEGRRAQDGDGAPTAAMRFRIKAAACVLERGRLSSTGCDPGRLSTRSCVAALCYGAWRESGCDAEPSRSERRGSESSLTVHALSARTEFAFTAVAPLLPTMTTVGSGVAIGSPAISSAGGGRSGLERGRELTDVRLPTALQVLQGDSAILLVQKSFRRASVLQTVLLSTIVASSFPLWC